MDQAWFFTPQWLAGEREADEEIAAGQGTQHESADDMFAHLDTLAGPPSATETSARPASPTSSGGA